jgi:hypothetical protein
MGTSKGHIGCRNVLRLNNCVWAFGHWVMEKICDHGPGYPPNTKVAFLLGFVSTNITQIFYNFGGLAY